MSTRCDPYDERLGTPDCSTICSELVTRLEEILGEIDTDTEEDDESSERYHQRILDALNKVSISFPR